ncbi:MAG: c-type cytochrome [Planctomycetes bacterium]|nr:c-type cytochrome [Planctomycetota bacterium]
MNIRRGHTLLTAAIIMTALASVAGGLGIWHFHNRRPAEPDLPEDYRSLENPLANTSATRDEGMRLFLGKGCAACHGSHADGRGPAAKGLTPPPANFVTGPLLRNHTDAYLFWRISEGKHGTAMPRWDGVLEEKERWAIVTFLRSLEGQ